MARQVPVKGTVDFDLFFALLSLLVLFLLLLLGEGNLKLFLLRLEELHGIEGQLVTAFKPEVDERVHVDDTALVLLGHVLGSSRLAASGWANEDHVQADLFLYRRGNAYFKILSHFRNNLRLEFRLLLIELVAFVVQLFLGECQSFRNLGYVSTFLRGLECQLVFVQLQISLFDLIKLS